MVDIGLSFAKYIVFIFNFLFAVSLIKVEIETRIIFSGYLTFCLQLIGLVMAAVGIILKTKLIEYHAFTGKLKSEF